ncbi:MAG: alanine racemase [Thermogemmatispora sp.]|jgi:alanine racemase|uniref:Multifunctional fusion protein n=1 Tax=Thermogemmatispora aurantia TaxID=2045279 RepID=A0A5J4K036_9CHLR|nr:MULTISPECIES: alanine racemase [Thermogemmatispora]MBE3566555.1 alanine racemase [Thermogemmatispora sp.]GER82544.1 alanine racemase [Thermogemmatispora aurantia]
MILLDHLLEATGGSLVFPGRQQQFPAFNHDTRQLLPGELFVAVRGERSDGHDYWQDALRRGAGGLLIEGRYFSALSEEQRAALQESGAAVVVVADTRQALQAYARAILARWRPTVIAVTGSTGKTTTKEAIAHVLERHFATFKSWQNYNDLLGLPLSLGRLEEHHEYAVVELGCDHPGEIGDLCRIAQPRIGVLTNISPTQLLYFGSLEHLATELVSLANYLPAEGTLVVNGDDELLRRLLRWSDDRHLQAFTATALEKVHVSWEGTEAYWSGSGQALRTRLLGAHFVTTMLAASTVGRLCGLSDEQIAQALAEFAPLPGRLNPLPGLQRTWLLDDTHNAAPASMLAALETLARLPARRRIAVLGDMFNLGTFEEEGHALVGQAAAGQVDYLVTRGERAALIAEAAHEAGLPAERIIQTSTHEDAARAVLALLEKADQPAEREPRDLVLIKGSEEARMERVTERLLAEPALAPERLVRQTPGWKQIVRMRPERPTWLEIDLSAIANNTRRIKELVGPRVQVLASLKADAYGHGALKVARTVLLNGASMLGVATVSEATPLREAGIMAPILVFGYVPHWQMREAVRLGLTITLYSSEAAQALSRAAQALQRTVKVHLKVDTGMGRLGIRAEEIEAIVRLAQEITRLPGLELEGIFTHFAMADAQDKSYTRKQLARFQQVLQALEAEGLRPPLAHAANSAATLTVPEAHFDMVRPGIALYGLDPSPEVRLPAGFRPALSFKTQVAQVKLVPEGECIGYGCTYVTTRPTRIAVLPVGYADGFRRAPRTWGSVLIHGKEAPIVGRVCMDQCMIDVTDIPGVRVGDEVVLIGRQGEAMLTAEQVAERLGTINYEVVSEILARVPRVD